MQYKYQRYTELLVSNVCMFAAKGGHADIVRIYKEHGAQVDAFADGNRNALILPVAKDHFKIATRLISSGASVDIMQRTMAPL